MAEQSPKPHHPDAVGAEAADSEAADSEAADDSKGETKGKGLKMLAWAGLGFVAARLLQRHLKRQGRQGSAADGSAAGTRREGTRAGRPVPISASEAGPREDAPREDAPREDAPREDAPREDALGEEGALLDLPADTERMWVPGPSGSLHLAQRNENATLPVLFVHGLGGSLDQWAPVLRRLGPGLRAIALDLPGHGRSDPASEPTIRAFSGSILAAANALGLRRFVLVAHDTGAAAAIALAAQSHARVAGLLLVDPTGDQSRLSEEERAHVLDSLREDAHAELGWHFRQVVGEAPEAVAEAVIEQLEATPPEVLVSALEAAFAYSPIDDLKGFDGPVRSILSPLNDMPFSLHRLLPESKVAVLPQAGHWLMLEHPDAVVELLEPLLDACRGRLESVH